MLRVEVVPDGHIHLLQRADEQRGPRQRVLRHEQTSVRHRDADVLRQFCAAGRDGLRLLRVNDLRNDFAHVLLVDHSTRHDGNGLPMLWHEIVPDRHVDLLRRRFEQRRARQRVLRHG